MDIFPSLREFTRLAKHATVVPVWAELLADLDTPVSALLKLDDGQASFLLESVEGAEKLARFSFLGSSPRLVISSRGRQIELSERQSSGAMRTRRYETATDPLRELEQLMQRYRPARVPQLPRFYGGLVGYIGYDMVRFLERVPAPRIDDAPVPDLTMMLTESMVIIDHAQHTMRLVCNAFLDGQPPERAYRRAVATIRDMAQRLARPWTPPAPRRANAATAVRSNLSRPQFEHMVRRAKQYIRAGDVIQVVLSQRFEQPVRASAIDIYRALRSLNPSPYMFFLRFGDTSLVGSSPEMLVRCEDGQLETRPIAGTRRRGATPEEDARLAKDLRGSVKERAEHLMLVDLGRNDLGRVAEVGSVATPELMTIESYSHVMHLVSGVKARLKRGKTAFDVLRAAFPAGTVSGAPKVRAMEIIAELEPDRRATYAGAVGYYSFSGNLDTCITIRTVLLNGGRASVQAGAGIVADSDPGREYDETANKARGCLQAIAMAERLATVDGVGARPRRPRTRRAR